MKFSKSWDLDKMKDDIQNNLFSKIWMISSFGPNTRRRSAGWRGALKKDGGLLHPLLLHLLGNTRVVGNIPVRLLEVFLNFNEKFLDITFPKRRKTKRFWLIIPLADCHIISSSSSCDPLPILSILRTLYIWDWHQINRKTS